MLRLSALSLQMASQVAALTLLAPPASVAFRARSALSVCQGRGGWRTFLPPHQCEVLPSVLSKWRSGGGISESMHIGCLRRFGLESVAAAEPASRFQWDHQERVHLLAGLCRHLTPLSSVHLSILFYSEAPLLFGFISYKFYGERQQSGCEVSREKQCSPIFSKPPQWRTKERWRPYWYLTGLSISGLEHSGPKGSWSSVSWVWECSSSHSMSSTRPWLELRDLAMAP